MYHLLSVLWNAAALIFMACLLKRLRRKPGWEVKHSSAIPSSCRISLISLTWKQHRFSQAQIFSHCIQLLQWHTNSGTTRAALMDGSLVGSSSLPLKANRRLFLLSAALARGSNTYNSYLHEATKNLALHHSQKRMNVEKTYRARHCTARGCFLSRIWAPERVSSW